MNRQLPEFWAVRLAVFAKTAQEALETADTRKAIWAMHHSVLSRCMLMFLRHLEELVWRGYRTFGVEELRSALHAWDNPPSGARELYWHRTLAEHSFVLSQLFSAPTLLIQGEAYVGGKRVDNRSGQVTDFLVQNALTRAVALVEIKTPETRLLGREYRNGVYAPSADLAGAVAQALVKEFYVNARRRAEFFPYDPPCIVVIGRTSILRDEPQRRSFELFRRGLKDVRVVTFDEVFGQARALLSLIESDPSYTT
jgi:hypothetical protein